MKRHLISAGDLSRDDAVLILDTAQELESVGGRAIRKLPTKTATKAKTRSGVPMNSLMSVTAFCSVSEAAWAPV